MISHLSSPCPVQFEINYLSFCCLLKDSDFKAVPALNAKKYQEATPKEQEMIRIALQDPIKTVKVEKVVSNFFSGHLEF